MNDKSIVHAYYINAYEGVLIVRPPIGYGGVYNLSLNNVNKYYYVGDKNECVNKKK